MAIASPSKKNKEGSLQYRNGDSFPVQRTHKKGLFKIEMAIASPVKEKTEGSLHGRNGDSFPLQRKNGLFKKRKTRRVSSR